MLSRRKPPINLQPAHQKFFEHEFVKELPDHGPIRFKNALITPDGVVFHDGKVAVESLFAKGHKKFFNGIYQMYYRCIGFFKRKNQGSYLLTFDAWAFGYFHWMTEFIPRLFKARQLIEECVTIIPSINNGIWNTSTALFSILKTRKQVGDQGYYTESLEAFQLKTTFKHSARVPLVAQNLCLLSHLAPSGNYDDQTMRELRTFYFDHYRITDIAPSRLVYVSRSQAPRRHIRNEEELTEILGSLGFESVSLETLPFREQVVLLSETRVLIGQHGAGLTNILFMRDSSFVLEFKTNGDFHNLCYFSLASAMNVNYLYQFCEGDGRNVQDSDITVDIELLTENLKLVL